VIDRAPAESVAAGRSFGAVSSSGRKEARDRLFSTLAAAGQRATWGALARAGRSRSFRARSDLASALLSRVAAWLERRLRQRLTSSCATRRATKRSAHKPALLAAMESPDGCSGANQPWRRYRGAPARPSLDDHGRARHRGGYWQRRSARYSLRARFSPLLRPASTVRQLGSALHHR